MFIVERLFGVGVFTLLLILACALIARRGSKYKRILFLYTIALAMMGFFYVPYETADLYRIYEFLDYFQTMNLPYFIERYGGSSTFIANLYYFFFAKLGEFRLLPAVTVFISYSCFFYVIKKTAELFDIERKNIALTLFFCMSIGTFMSAISGIRTVLSISLVVFCFFRESVEKKFKWYHIPLYFFAAFIHNFAVVIIFIRLLIPLFDRNIKFERKFVYTIFLVIIFIFMAFNMSDLLEAVFEKAEGYITGDAYSYTWGYLLAALVLFTSTYVLVKYSKIRLSNSKILFQLKVFSIVALFISIVFCFEYSIFARTLTIFLPFVVAPCFMVALQNRKSPFFFRIILMLSIAIMVVSFSRGSMCSYKFFEL